PPSDDGDPHAVAEQERDSAVPEHTARDRIELVDQELPLELLFGQVGGRRADAAREADDPIRVALFERVQHDLAAVAKAAARSYSFKVPVLRPHVAAPLDPDGPPPP